MGLRRFGPARPLGGAGQKQSAGALVPPCSLLISILAAIAALPTGARAVDKPLTGVADLSIATSLSPRVADPLKMRAPLANAGIVYGFNYIGEFFSVVSGGLKEGTTGDGRLEGYVKVDFSKYGWNGGAISANAFYIHGEGASAKYIGSIFAVSNVEARETLRFFEYWFEQSLFNDKLKIRLGQVAADSEFFISDYAGQFFNGTFGWPGITASDMPAGGPAYPLATPGARMQFGGDDDRLKLLVGVFNGSPADPLAEDPQIDNRHGTSFRLNDPPLVKAEAQIKYNDAKASWGLPGVLRVGAWYHFDDFAHQRTAEPLGNDYGVYGVIDQLVYRLPGREDKGIGVFGRLAVSPSDVDAGVKVSAIVPHRPDDSFGGAFAHGRISDEASAADIDAGLAVVRSYEALLELNYAAQIVPGWVVIPDFQYIWNPGGEVALDDDDPSSPEVEDAAVLGVRTVLNY